MIRTMTFALAALVSTTTLTAATNTYRTWEVYNGGPEAMKYSALDQVNRTNVHRLKVAWTYRSRDESGGVQSNPVIIRDTMFVLGPNNKIIALNAASGEHLWTHPSTARGTATRRGLVYWENQDRTDRRVFFTVGPSLLALNATNGEPIRSFGSNGVVTLYVDRNSTRTAGAPSPGIIFEDLLIMGSVVGEMWNGAPGNIRAYDVRTGELRWVFRTVPHPDEFGYDTWPPDSYLGRNGGANVWGAFSVDLKRGIVFAPTGSPSYDFYGADRKGQNLFGNCVIALNARTGKRVWHYQVVHHDLWDYDLSAQPLLATITHEGKRVEVVIQVTKHGFIFVLDRDTGKPVFPVEERPVPKSDLPGEEAWPTQPFPLKPAPVARQHITIDDLTEFPDAAERQAIREKFLASRTLGLFTPPSTNGTIAAPGHNGGPLWGGGAFDPETEMFYVSSHDQPSYFKMTQQAAGTVISPQNEVRFTTPWTFFRDSSQLPAIKPPWGHMTAIDMKTGDTKWEKLIGDEKVLVERGLPQTGHKYLKGGPVVTAGGLVFMAGTLDKRLRAFDKKTGELVWTGELPFNSVAIPAIYELGGKQFIVITAMAPGDAVVAFALEK